MPSGLLITVEGGEGTGKSTQLARLASHLRDHGREVVVTREPGGTMLAEGVRALLLDPGQAPDPLSEIFLLAAARHDHVERVVRPALGRGAIVLCDRYTDSSLVYQGMVGGLGLELVGRLNGLATDGLEPDLTLVYDLEPEAALDRVRARGNGADPAESRLDAKPAAFHRRVCAGFRRLAGLAPQRVRLVDARGTPDEVFDRTLAALPEELR